MDGFPVSTSSVKEPDMPKKPYSGEPIIEKPPVVEIVSDSRINSETFVVSLIEAHLTYSGKSSGRQYEWKKAGDVTRVLNEDVPELLEKRLGGTPCCGNNPTGNLIFQIVSGG